MTDSNSLP